MKPYWIKESGKNAKHEVILFADDYHQAIAIARFALKQTLPLVPDLLENYIYSFEKLVNLMNQIGFAGYFDSFDNRCGFDQHMTAPFIKYITRQEKIHNFI